MGFKVSIFLCMIALASTPHHLRADVIISPTVTTEYGRPVEAIGSSTQAVPDSPDTEGDASYDPATGQIQYYIPLSASSSGDYGVTSKPWGTAGTTQTSGKGRGTDGNDVALSIYLEFDPLPTGTDQADLQFSFDDLDLIGAADTTTFFEAVRFLDASNNLITPIITSLGQASTPSDPYSYTVTGDSDNQVIVIEDVLSLLGTDPLYVQVQLFSASNTNTSNILDNLTASLIGTDNGPEAPAPGVMAILLPGALSLATRRRHPAGIR